MKKVWKLLVVCTMAFAMVGCGGGDSSDDTTTLLIGISPDYPPYESLNNNNEMEGFDIDMVDELVKIMNENGGNYKAEFKQMSFDTIVSAVNTSQVDLGISGFTYDEERDVAWSEAYNDSKQVALVNPDSDIKTVDDLKGKTIGAQLGATAETAANDIEGAKVTAVSDVKVLIETLKTGGLDAVILDYAVAKNYQENAGFVMIDESLLDEENFIITNKSGNEDLLKDVNAAIEKFIASDKYLELKEKWGV
ncbi:MAG: transporter substrate-binding domain-containing protein [Coprobacillaceae bacterium]